VSPPGSALYPFAGGPTHEPPRAAHGKRCCRPLEVNLAAVRGVWEWLAHGIRRAHGVRHDWPSFARRRRGRRWGRWL
jgi:hypothetical protein